MKKTAKKSVKKYAPGGNIDPVKRAVSDSTSAAKFEKSPAYAKASDAMKKVVQLKKQSPSDARKGKETKYGSTPVKYIPLQKRGGSVKRKK